MTLDRALNSGACADFVNMSAIISELVGVIPSGSDCTRISMWNWHLYSYIEFRVDAGLYRWFAWERESVSVNKICVGLGST